MFRVFQLGVVAGICSSSGLDIHCFQRDKDICLPKPSCTGRWKKTTAKVFSQSLLQGVCAGWLTWVACAIVLLFKFQSNNYNTICYSSHITVVLCITFHCPSPSPPLAPPPPLPSPRCTWRPLPPKICSSLPTPSTRHSVLASLEGWLNSTRRCVCGLTVCVLYS